MLRRVGLRGREPIGGARRGHVGGGPLSRPRWPTFATELLARGGLGLARWGKRFEARPAFSTELLTPGGFRLTIRPLHQRDSRTVASRSTRTTYGRERYLLYDVVASSLQVVQCLTTGAGRPTSPYSEASERPLPCEKSKGA